MIARVTLEIALRKEFDYFIPPELAEQVDVGSRVQVPFGSRKVLGCVTGLAEESAHARLKPILKVIGAQTLVTPKILKLARWIGEYYCCAPETALKSVLPEAVRHEQANWRERLHVRALPVTGELPKLPKRQKEVWRILEERPELPLSELLALAKTTAATVRRLEDRGLLTLAAEISERDPYAREHILPTQPLTLNPAQANALAAIIAAMDEGGAECGMRNAECQSPQSTVQSPLAQPPDVRSPVVRHGPRNTQHATRNTSPLLDLPPPRRHGQRQDRGVSASHRPRPGTGQGRDCPRPGNLAHAADRRAVQGAVQFRPIADAGGGVAQPFIRRGAA